MNISNSTIAIVGLGYVGLPLAVEFGKRRAVVGFDLSTRRVTELKAGNDATLEVDSAELAAAKYLAFSNDPEDLKACGVFIVAVPTPIDKANRPDLGLLRAASRTVGRALRAGGVVVYESTVYPGCTRDDCVPILEQESGLTFNKDFFVGYSPERINPGDHVHRLPDIVKVTSGSTPEAAKAVDELYREIIRAGTHSAASIEVAEAAKVIENTQRDLNIALMNELAVIFKLLGIDTQEVLAAAGTKWNFLPFRPGLVGGHCIGVDPYYLTHKAQELGYHPSVILSGRRINDEMGAYVADQVAMLMMSRRMPVVDSRILVMGMTFKENCPDLRNTKVVDVVRRLAQMNAQVDVYDPWASPDEARREYGLDLVKEAIPGSYDAIVLTVAHKQFAEMGADAIRALGKDGAVLYDVKGVLPRHVSDARL